MHHSACNPADSKPGSIEQVIQLHEFAIRDRKIGKNFFVFAYSCTNSRQKKIRIRLLKIFRIRL